MFEALQALGPMSVPNPLLLGVAISPLQIGLMVLFLLSSGFIFTVIQDEMSFTSAFGVAGGLWLFSSVMTFLML